MAYLTPPCPLSFTSLPTCLLLQMHLCFSSACETCLEAPSAHETVLPCFFFFCLSADMNSAHVMGFESVIYRSSRKEVMGKLQSPLSLGTVVVSLCALMHHDLRMTGSPRRAAIPAGNSLFDSRINRVHRMKRLQCIALPLTELLSTNMMVCKYNPAVVWSRALLLHQLPPLSLSRLSSSSCSLKNPSPPRLLHTTSAKIPGALALCEVSGNHLRVV